MEWLDGILRDEGPRHDLRLVFGHLPIWPVTQGREGDVIGDPAFLALLAGHGAEAYFSGHHHGWYPARRDGVRLLAQACLGDGPRKYIGGGRAECGFGLLRIDGDGTLHLESRAASAFSGPIEPSRLPVRIGEGADLLEQAKPG